MQSSSALFPVTLASAELCAGLNEDVYRLKPGNSPDPSVTLAVTRLQQSSGGVPVVLLHGSFSNRRFWCSPRGIGLGAELARAGFDVWIPEMRGHGLSPRNQAYDHNTVADYARYDLPSIAAFVMEQSGGQRPHWIGHSLGGTTLAAALGGAYLTEHEMASVVLFGTQVSRVYWPIKIPPLAWGGRFVLKRMGLLPGRRLKRGPEDEPLGLGLEAIRWHQLFGRFGDADKDWWFGLTQAKVPMLAFAGEGDHQDPAWCCRKLAAQYGASPRYFLNLGAQTGFSHNFGHVDMLISRAAQEEVWPLVQAWLTTGECAHPSVERLD
ncbi:alpha/beta fold hydrolase [Atopomonas sediminilitoris]|uniref:alpha/beta fold hydrolase n=1 Tax=Atopomonas sediminilitoris TaxID=2919919 RepID=UPI001F4E7A99|nr:alpha/beta hydrolase [Atopomonas sediminilitoris]MCJ8167825.1 alpha/beta fold hydrolase [Atopomonas sediminilitoris]